MARERSSGEQETAPSNRRGVDGRRVVENVRQGSMDQGPGATQTMAHIAESPRMRQQ